MAVAQTAARETGEARTGCIHSRGFAGFHTVMDRDGTAVVLIGCIIGFMPSAAAAAVASSWHLLVDCY